MGRVDPSSLELGEPTRQGASTLTQGSPRDVALVETCLEADSAVQGEDLGL